MLASSSSTAVKHWTLNLTIKGLNKAAGTGREEMLVRFKLFVSSKKHFYAFEARLLTSHSSAVVEHLTLNPLIKGLNPAIGTGREKSH